MIGTTNTLPLVFAVVDGAQIRVAIIAECERRGWHLVETIEDAGYSARDLRRPGIQEALTALERQHESLRSPDLRQVDRSIV